MSATPENGLWAIPIWASSAARSWASSLKLIDRRRATLFRCFAVTGMYSEIWTPLTAVSMAFALPPFGRPGFGSKVSTWLGAPGSQIRITVVAFLDFGASFFSSFLGVSGRVSWAASDVSGEAATAPMPNMLNDRKSRRPYAGTMHLLHAI